MESGGGTSSRGAVNDILVYPVYIPATTPVAGVRIRVVRTSETHKWGMGVYDADGNRKFETGAQNMNSQGVQEVSVSTGNLPAGQYYFAFTSNTNTGSFAGSITGGQWGKLPRKGNISGGNAGVLPDSITLTSITESAFVPWMVIHAANV